MGDTPPLEIRAVSPRLEQARALIQELDRYQAELYPAESNHLDSEAELEQPHVRFLGAFLQGELVGCGAVKLVAVNYGEIKRMYVASHVRGQGVAKRLLRALEETLLAEGVLLSRLETGIHQREALDFYRKQGYREIEPFGSYAPDPLSVFMEKTLGSHSLQIRP